jgi:hypothetical protein
MLFSAAIVYPFKLMRTPERAPCAAMPPRAKVLQQPGAALDHLVERQACYGQY